MAKDIIKTVRLTSEDLAKWERLAKQAGVPKAQVLTALLRSAEEIAPPVEARAKFCTGASGESAQHA